MREGDIASKLSGLPTEEGSLDSTLRGRNGIGGEELGRTGGSGRGREGDWEKSEGMPGKEERRENDMLMSLKGECGWLIEST